MNSQTHLEQTKAERRWKRFRVEIPVRVEISLNGNNASFFSKGTDISQGGLCLFIPRELGLGVMVGLVLCLPYSRENLKLKGVIRNRSGFHYGIEFIDCRASERQVITQNCRALEILE